MENTHDGCACGCGSASGAGTAIDLVCKMTVDPATAPYHAEHEGVTYYFCASGCRKTFLKAPERFLDAEAVVPAGRPLLSLGLRPPTTPAGA